MLGTWTQILHIVSIMFLFSDLSPSAVVVIQLQTWPLLVFLRADTWGFKLLLLPGASLPVPCVPRAGQEPEPPVGYQLKFPQQELR